MSTPNILNAQEALALANVINPLGQRVDADGRVQPGRDGFYEENCALVAIATAAFLKDGTEVSAMAAPSQLCMQSGFANMQCVTSQKSLGNEYAPEVNPPDFDTFEDFIAGLKNVLDQYPGQQFLVHGIDVFSHHWFNITQEGLVIDVQVGLAGDDLLLEQTRNTPISFDELRIYPVDPDLSGNELIKSTEGIHQAMAMMFLSYSTIRAVGFSEESYLKIFDEIRTPFEKAQIELGAKDDGVLFNLTTAQCFNAIVDQVVKDLDAQGKDGVKEVVDALTDLITPRESLTVGRNRQVWLAEATYGEPGSLEKTPSVVDVFRDRVPSIALAMNALDVARANPTQEPGRAR